MKILFTSADSCNNPTVFARVYPIWGNASVGDLPSIKFIQVEAAHTILLEFVAGSISRVE